jgi:hypothetical protein
VLVRCLDFQIEDGIPRYIYEITFGAMAMTKIFCPDYQEQDFAKMFEEIRSYFFTSKGELFFEFKSDSGIAIFR